MFFKKISNFLNLNNLFIGLFFIVICAQFLVLDKLTLDRSMWADQALYFETNRTIVLFKPKSKTLIYPINEPISVYKPYSESPSFLIIKGVKIKPIPLVKIMFR